jgi:hypothetical protein
MMHLRAAFDVLKLKPFRLRYITIDCCSIGITDRDGFVLAYGDVKTDVVLVVC